VPRQSSWPDDTARPAGEQIRLQLALEKSALATLTTAALTADLPAFLVRTCELAAETLHGVGSAVFEETAVGAVLRAQAGWVSGGGGQLFSPIPGRRTTWGRLAVYSLLPRIFTTGEQEFLALLGRIVSLGLARHGTGHFDAQPRPTADAAEWRRVEAALKASEARFATIFQLSPIPITIATIDEGRVLDVNDAWLAMTGYQRAEVLGGSSTELGLVPSGVRGHLLSEFLREGAARDFEASIRRRDGYVREVLISAVSVEIAGAPPCWIAALLDITERKRAEREREVLLERERASREQLRAMSRRLLSAQENERRRVAVELHDELGQVLTAAKISLESIGRGQGDTPPPAAAAHAIECVDQAMQCVRDLALDLRPSVLDDLGLTAALRWYVDRFARKTGLTVAQTIDPVPPLEPAVETSCFRLVQEALTNVVRHARATHVRLELHLTEQRLLLRIQDDGVGFDPAAARAGAIGGSSLGLLGMEDRVAVGGGEFTISSGAGLGTEILARFPIIRSDGQR